MSYQADNLPADFPEFLKHSDDDAPVPSWPQVTRSAKLRDEKMIEHVSRIVAGTGDEQAALAVWDSWPGNYRRSVALLIDKIIYEGWLDLVGPIDGWPWDGGFFFWPRENCLGILADLLNSKAGKGGNYTGGKLSKGLFAYLHAWNHKSWRESWMENDVALSALHIGIFERGTIEAHFDAFNPLFINGAPRSDLIKIPLLGSANYKLYRLHRRWEQSRYASITRRSANFYHMMSGRVPLCF
jgi:hypothetical protein